MPQMNGALVKAVALGLVASIAAVAIVSTLLRRRKRRPDARASRRQQAWEDLGTIKDFDEADTSGYEGSRALGSHIERVETQQTPGSRDKMPGGQSPGYMSRSAADELALESTRLGSDNVSSLSTTVTLEGSTTVVEDESLAMLMPQQVYHLGVEKLHRARALWEETLTRLQADSASAGPLERRLKTLLWHVKQLETLCEAELEPSVTPTSQAVYGSGSTSTSLSTVGMGDVLETSRQFQQELENAQEEWLGRSRRSGLSADESDDESSQDSFVSALEVADLSDLEEHMQAARQWSGGKGATSRQLLYEAALVEVQQGNVPYRKLRTALVGCSSDSEFLARLHAVRMGLDELLKNEANRQWLVETGKRMVGKVLEQSARDPKDFEMALESIVEFVREPENWEITKEELLGRNVKSYTFYDIVLDFILMDAFDDLANPPASVTSVTLNRWLSNGLKETALSTAVWSVLKAKRRMLKFSCGFIAHFYTLSEQVSPALAWGFLGPDSELKEACYAFKDQVMGFITDLYNPNKVRYTSVEEMAADIMSTARRRAAIVMSVLHNGDVQPT